MHGTSQIGGEWTLQDTGLPDSMAIVDSMRLSNSLQILGLLDFSAGIVFGIFLVSSEEWIVIS